MKPYTLIINLSLRSIRVIVFDRKGKKVYEDWLPVRTSISGSNVEQDPNEWWELLQNLLETLSRKKDIASNIRYISVTSSGLCLVMLDDRGTVLGKSIMVSDKRAGAESTELSEKFSDYFDKHQNMRAIPSFMMPKILWLKHHEPLIFKNTSLYMASNDFLIYRLTGKFVTDYLNAEKMYYDVESKKYPASLLTYIGIRTSQLPQVEAIGTKIGTAGTPIQKLLGAGRPISVAVSTYDAVCALIGSSTYQPGELNNVCGTCSSYRMFLPKKHELTGSTLIVQSLPEEKSFIIGGSNNLEGGVLEWAKECFYGDSYLKDDSFLYGLMQKEAEKSELGAGGIIFLPYLLGERVPFSDPHVRGMFFGVERFTRRGDIIRSIYEAVAFQARLMIDEFETSEIEVSSITMSGGVAKMPFAAKIRSDVLGMPVHVLSEIETTALGAFILTEKAHGKITSIKEGTKHVTVKKTYIPNMHHHNAYSSLFLLYKQLYTTNKALFESKQAVTEKIINYQKTVLQNL
ncbi:MAG: FGGY family carbohydrate kinase [Candidatus Roizmanbacteria bacterium]|nr:FGGY family carbohydrate kinase [Candidatus Roizmanbacteria bacterium]